MGHRFDDPAPPTNNPDTRELETLEGSALLEQQRYAEAAQHAQAAVALAHSSAIDPNSSAWIGGVDNLDPTHPLIAEARALSLTSASAHDYSGAIRQPADRGSIPTR